MRDPCGVGKPELNYPIARFADPDFRADGAGCLGRLVVLPVDHNSHGSAQCTVEEVEEVEDLNGCGWLFPKHSLFVWQRDEIEKLWDRLKPVVAAVQQPGRPHYCVHFKYLAGTWFPVAKRKYADVPLGSSARLDGESRRTIQQNFLARCGRCHCKARNSMKTW
jgi:hypothetical protein